MAITSQITTKPKKKRTNKGYIDRFPASILKNETAMDYQKRFWNQKEVRQIAKGLAVENLTERLKMIGRTKLPKGDKRDPYKDNWEGRHKVEVLDNARRVRLAKKYDIKSIVDESRYW